MKLTLENEQPVELENVDDLLPLLEKVDGKTHTFAILVNADGHFIQTLNQGDGFVIERQLGSLEEHFEAIPSTISAEPRPKNSFWKRLFEQEQPSFFVIADVIACFAAFHGGLADPAHVNWRKMVP